MDHFESERNAFRNLCEALEMQFVCENEGQYTVQKVNDENVVFLDGEPFDDRGDLFIAIENLAVCMFPNLEIIGEDYIYNYSVK